MDNETRIVLTGDVIEVDNSICISLLGKDNRTIRVGQNFRLGAPDSSEAGKYIPNMEGPHILNMAFHGKGRIQTLAEKIAEAGVQILGKNFLVVATTQRGSGHDTSSVAFPNGHHVTARELTPENKIKPDGLSIEFYQTGFFNDNVMVRQPAVVGRMEPTFGPYKPL